MTMLETFGWGCRPNYPEPPPDPFPIGYFDPFNKRGDMSDKRFIQPDKPGFYWARSHKAEKQSQWQPVMVDSMGNITVLANSCLGEMGTRIEYGEEIIHG